MNLHLEGTAIYREAFDVTLEDLTATEWSQLSPREQHEILGRALNKQRVMIVLSDIETLRIETLEECEEVRT